jgi:hypothetical protein
MVSRPQEKKRILSILSELTIKRRKTIISLVGAETGVMGTRNHYPFKTQKPGAGLQVSLYFYHKDFS